MYKGLNCLPCTVLTSFDSVYGNSIVDVVHDDLVGKEIDSDLSVFFEKIIAEETYSIIGEENSFAWLHYDVGFYYFQTVEFDVGDLNNG